MGNLISKQNFCYMCKQYIYNDGFKCLKCKKIIDLNCFKEYNEIAFDKNVTPCCKQDRYLLRKCNKYGVLYN
jgi:hypothetical protein